MTLADRIERTMVLPAQRQRVWEAVTKPEQLTRWLGVVSDMDFRVGVPSTLPGKINHAPIRA